MNDLVLVSVDDHIIEPPTLFDQHLSPEHRKLAPRFKPNREGIGTWQWAHENLEYVFMNANAVVGRPREEYGMEAFRFEDMRCGTWDVHARVDDMNVNGLAASLNFGSFPGFDGSWFWPARDKQNALRVLRAYNDWHIDEWCGAYPGRFIPMGLLPLWNVEDSVAEVQRLVAKGCRAVCFPANPTVKGLPSIHNDVWEPLWAVCNEESVVLNCHIGTGMPAAYSSAESPVTAWLVGLPIAIFPAASDWLHLRALLRYPKLKISLSEGGIGWVPYFLERAEFTLKHHGPWTRCGFEKKSAAEVFREHFLTCFFDDRFGCENLDRIGEDAVMFECDYPHADCTWPESPEELMKNFSGLSDATIAKISHGNALREYHYDLFGKLGGRENCTVGALRAKAGHVDTRPQSKAGMDPARLGDPRKPVTSADIAEMLKGRGFAAPRA